MHGGAAEACLRLECGREAPWGAGGRRGGTVRPICRECRPLPKTDSVSQMIRLIPLTEARSVVLRQEREKVHSYSLMRLKRFIVAFSALACTSQPRGERVDPSSLEWPIGLALDPAGDYLYVVSSNFDTRRSGSTVVPIHLTTLDLLAGSAVEIGSFAGDIVVLPGPSGHGAAGYVAVRAGDQIQFFTIVRSDNGVTLNCFRERPPEGTPRCEPAYRLALEGQLRDPFALALGSSGSNWWLYVGSILDGTLALMPIGSDLAPYPQKVIQLSPGLHSIIEGPDIGDGWRRVFVSNRLVNAIHVIDIRPDGRDFSARLQDNLSIGHVSSTGDYFRGLAITADRRTLVAAFRSPASLAVLDLDQYGSASLRGLVPLRSAPAGVAIAHYPEATRVYVTDFLANTVYCINLQTLEVEDRIPVDDGPYGIAILQDSFGPKAAFVAAFESHRVVVIDLVEHSPKWHQVVATLPRISE